MIARRSRAALGGRRAGAAAAALAALVAAACRAPVSGPDAGAALAVGRDVRILRDVWGVPHVFGRTDADVAFGLAYAHAEDDFETIQLALLAARGRLASLIGRRGAPNDYLVALLGLRDEVERRYETDLDPRTRALLEGYAAGLSLYAARHPADVAPGLLPVRGRDVAAGFAHKAPLFFGLGDEVERLVHGDAARTAPGTGSNALAVGPARSADGVTRLAVNSHQPWTGPVAWYEVHVRSDEGWEAAGGLFPGSPVVLHGHNRHLGWAFTVNRPDLIDVYRLAIDPGDPDRYLLDGAWRDLDVETAEIEVKLLGPLHWTFRREIARSVHGPVLRLPHGTYALRIAAAHEIRQVEQWYRMNRATSYDEWEAAMRMRAIASFHAVYADAEGHVAYVYNATLPERDPSFDWDGVLPGDTSAAIWRDTVAFERLPHVLDPSAGFVQSCNSSPFLVTQGPDAPRPEGSAGVVGIDERRTNRALRALELLGADAEITAAEFEAYKFDVAYSARSVVPELVERILADAPFGDPVLDAAARTLRAWDLRADEDNRGAAIGVLSVRATLAARHEGGAAPDLRAEFERAARALYAAHGRVDVPWSRVNRLRRGAVDLGLAGAPDVLRAIYGGELEDGRLTAERGDSFVMLVEFGPDGVRSRSIQPFGSAPVDSESPHYADQASRFARGELKPVWLDEAEIRAHLAREYRPTSPEETGPWYRRPPR